MPTVQAGDQVVHYLERGQGRPVILVHGNWASSAWWEPVLERLAGRYRALAYDMRGRGHTRGPDSDYAISSLATDLGDFAAALGQERFHLVGHSLGSAVVMQYALEQPERIISLTALSPAWVDGMPAAYNAPEGQQALKADKSLFSAALKQLVPTVEEGPLWYRLVEQGHAQRLEAALRNLTALVTWAPGDRLGATGVPSLVVSGALDPLTGGDNAARAAVALGAKHLLFEDLGHSPNIEDPERFVEVLTSHMTRAEK